MGCFTSVITSTQVCALAVCSNGKYIASGQLGSETQKVCGA